MHMILLLTIFNMCDITLYGGWNALPTPPALHEEIRWCNGVHIGLNGRKTLLDYQIGTIALKCGVSLQQNKMSIDQYEWLTQDMTFHYWQIELIGISVDLSFFTAEVGLDWQLGTMDFETDGKNAFLGYIRPEIKFPFFNKANLIINGKWLIDIGEYHDVSTVGIFCGAFISAGLKIKL